MFSPDGKSVLFTSTRGGKAGIWRMVLDGSKPERICDGDQAEWSPDGKQHRVAPQRTDPDARPRRRQGEGHQPGGLAALLGSGLEPGRQVDRLRRPLGGAATRSTSCPAEGGKPVKVYDKQGACEPHWSPDGTRLVYETETHICTINPDGTKNRVITYFGGVQRYARLQPRRQVARLLPGRVGARPVGALRHPCDRRHAAQADRRRVGYVSGLEVIPKPE